MFKIYKLNRLGFLKHIGDTDGIDYSVRNILATAKKNKHNVCCGFRASKSYLLFTDVSHMNVFLQEDNNNDFKDVVIC